MKDNKQHLHVRMSQHGFTSYLTNTKSFKRRVFAGNQLHWY